MIWIQTQALIIDAYRDLHARKIFWIVLILNLLAVLAFAAFGVHGNSLSVLWYDFPSRSSTPTAALFAYKFGFSYIVVGIWLTWIAIILAIFSTASIFPELLASGSIDLYLSKPIGRVRLFLTKYMCGLMFVALQVAVFTFGSFLVLGIRAGIWEPGLLLAIPLVVLFFSYLWAICTFFGVYTRSTIATLLLTFLCWVLIFGVNFADRKCEELITTNAAEHDWAVDRLARLDREIAQAQAQPAATNPDGVPPRMLSQLNNERQSVAFAVENSKVSDVVLNAQKVLIVTDTLIPKTAGTTDLIDRVLFKDKDMTQMLSDDSDAEGQGSDSAMQDLRHVDAKARLSSINHGRSVFWIIGSSLAFEALVLALACMRFCKRDY